MAGHNKPSMCLSFNSSLLAPRSLLTRLYACSSSHGPRPGQILRYASLDLEPLSNASSDWLLRKDLNANRHKYFRWTPRTAWITFVYVGLVPGIIGYLGYTSDVSIIHSQGLNSDREELERGRNEWSADRNIFRANGICEGRREAIRLRNGEDENVRGIIGSAAKSLCLQR